jgi:hypothetical protein
MIKKIALLFSISFFALLSCKHKTIGHTKSEKLTDSVQMAMCDELIVRLHSQRLDSITTVAYLPLTFEECLSQLDTLINDSLKLWVKCLPDGYFGNIVHQSFGMYLRNKWKLWGGSQLSDNLNAMGILHPDDMSAIILDSYQRKLKGEAINLDEQIKRYQDYWRKSGYPVDSFLDAVQKKQIH